MSREPAKNLGSLLGQSPEELLFLTNVGRGQVIMVLSDQTRIGQTWGRNSISICPHVEEEGKSELLAAGEPRRWPEPRTGVGLGEGPRRPVLTLPWGCLNPGSVKRHAFKIFLETGREDSISPTLPSVQTFLSTRASISILSIPLSKHTNTHRQTHTHTNTRVIFSCTKMKKISSLPKLVFLSLLPSAKTSY